MALTAQDLLSGLQPARWRGVEFFMPDVRQATGRRVQSFLFPGLDIRVHQDMGAMDGPLTVSGLIVGDDYAQRAQLLTEAFRTAGPATLVHPWYGELRLVLVNQPEILLDQRRLRVAAFSATFEWYREQPEPAFDTLGLLLLAIAAVKAAVIRMLRELLAPVRLAFGVVAAVAGLALWMKGSFTNILGTLTNGGALLGLLGPEFSALTGLGSIANDATYGDNVGAAFAGVPEAAAGTTLPAATPAVAPATETAGNTDLQLDAEAVAAVLLGAAAWSPPPAILPPAGVVLAMQCLALGAAAAAAARIEFTSRQQALAWKGRVDAAIVARMTALAAVAADAPQTAGGLYQALADLRVALARDFRAELGRLPAVRTITVPAACSLWLVANHLAGGDPARIVPLLNDLTTRNQLRNPAAVPAGAVLEYLA